LKLLVEVHPHVIVSDISMPGQDGYNLMKQIRSMGAGFGGRELPSIALTAYARTEDRRRALLAGFQMHVAKPVDPHELAEVVASLAGRTGLG
jgi:CheY-like chemotaxis protein